MIVRPRFAIGFIHRSLADGLALAIALISLKQEGNEEEELVSHLPRHLFPQQHCHRPQKDQRFIAVAHRSWWRPT
jgi:hypothetical protein